MSISMSMSLMGRSSLRRSIHSFLPSTSTFITSTTTKYPLVSWFQQQLQLPNTTDQRLVIAEHHHELQIRSQLYNMDMDMDVSMNGESGTDGSIVSGVDTGSSILEDMATWLISTLKRRKKKMNKHKLKKRRKKLRLKSNK
eukprot:CAMPEP_0204619828 /NCGR_PEP_ID=MMETSP0717-20131115/6069_1 /ASSEMBLY_ACC=CAM_ASM_000666 /TAXON_ID=230516 /ORGANISM="Chaetoceros curvisetus" /LENGTH=140 /DNA_ID=CAMNT_0051633901 /DNA_START=110 /DNA_END=535 /DNA_ORIENTATION=+